MRIIIILFFASSAVIAQGHFGIEIRTSQNMTYNRGQIRSGGGLHSFYEVVKEANPVTTSYSMGVVYAMNNHSAFKLHVGRHRNGRIIDLNVYDDVSLQMEFNEINKPYNYIQFVPSYSYSIQLGKNHVPFDIGIAVNKRIHEENIFFIGIDKYNFDMRLSAGYEYEIRSAFYLNLNVVYSHSLSKYQNDKIVFGDYIPIQLGIEISAKYFLVQNSFSDENE